MKRFLAIYHIKSGSDAWSLDTTPEEREKGMQQWMNWKARNEDHIVEFGSPTGPRSVIGKGDTHTSIAGFSILQAEDMDAIKATCADHPHVGWHDDAYIEMIELIDM